MRWLRYGDRACGKQSGPIHDFASSKLNEVTYIMHQTIRINAFDPHLLSYLRHECPIWMDGIVDTIKSRALPCVLLYRLLASVRCLKSACHITLDSCYRHASVHNQNNIYR